MDLHESLVLAQGAVAAATVDDAARDFASAVERVGASYFQARLYQRPGGRLTSKSHWQAGGVVLRRAKPGWVGSAGFHFICFDKNPLLTPIRRGLTRYRFSDFAPHAALDYGDYWEALSQAQIGEGLCATAYGHDRMVASVHLGLPTADVDPGFAEMLSLAAAIFAERLMSFAEPPPVDAAPPLSRREQDAMEFVAEGKTDWEIATILGISDKTARFHVDNARRKLHAVNRSHAVACYLAQTPH